LHPLPQLHPCQLLLLSLLLLDLGQPTVPLSLTVQHRRSKASPFLLDRLVGEIPNNVG
jgi:hypothetical protein